MRFFFICFSLFCVVSLTAQTYAIVADRLIDPKAGKVHGNPTVVVQGTKIIDVNYTQHIPADAVVIDLKGHTLLPGLMDVHTHLLSNGLEPENDLYKNSSSFRSLRAVQHLSIALQNGFTTVRDVCTEGAGYADVDLSRAVDSGYVPGPRVFASGRGIAATGSYLPRPRKLNWELDLPAATQYASGVAECLKAVREQENHNVKWIKLFGDWGTDPTFSFEEIKAVVDDAYRYPLPVAAHAKSKEGIFMCLQAGVRSIEHGDAFDDSLIAFAVRKKAYWCPTLTWEEYHGRASAEKYAAINRAYRAGLPIVCGSDAGGFPWRVNAAKELEYLVRKAKFSAMDAIRTATVNAAELLGVANKLGSIKKNFLADVIAVKGNPLDDIQLLQDVKFVMKEGVVYKQSSK